MEVRAHLLPHLQDADVHFYSRMEMDARKPHSLIGPDSVHMKAIAIETECIFHYPQTAVVDGVTSIAMQAKHPFQIVVARKCILVSFTDLEEERRGAFTGKE